MQGLKVEKTVEEVREQIKHHATVLFGLAIDLKANDKELHDLRKENRRLQAQIEKYQKDKQLLYQRQKRERKQASCKKEQQKRKV